MEAYRSLFQLKWLSALEVLFGGDVCKHMFGIMYFPYPAYEGMSYKSVHLNLFMSTIDIGSVIHFYPYALC